MFRFQSLKVLTHHNIVSIKELILEKEQLYFVFEFMDTDLCKIVQHQRFVMGIYYQRFVMGIYCRMHGCLGHP